MTEESKIEDKMLDLGCQLIVLHKTCIFVPSIHITQMTI